MSPEDGLANPSQIEDELEKLVQLSISKICKAKKHLYVKVLAFSVLRKLIRLQEDWERQQTERPPEKVQPDDELADLLAINAKVIGTKEDSSDLLPSSSSSSSQAESPSSSSSSSSSQAESPSSSSSSSSSQAESPSSSSSSSHAIVQASQADVGTQSGVMVTVTVSPSGDSAENSRAMPAQDEEKCASGTSLTTFDALSTSFQQASIGEKQSFLDFLSTAPVDSNPSSVVGAESFLDSLSTTPVDSNPSSVMGAESFLDSLSTTPVDSNPSSVVGAECVIQSSMTASEAAAAQAEESSLSESALDLTRTLKRLHLWDSDNGHSSKKFQIMECPRCSGVIKMTSDPKCDDTDSDCDMSSGNTASDTSFGTDSDSDKTDCDMSNGNTACDTSFGTDSDKTDCDVSNSFEDCIECMCSVSSLCSDQLMTLTL